MTVAKKNQDSSSATKVRSSTQSPSVKETVLGKPLLSQPRNSSNTWQDRYDTTFLHAHFPTYEQKTLCRKGKEYAIQCADQYFRLYDVKCKQLFDPNLKPEDPVTDLMGFESWKKKRTAVRITLTPFQCGSHVSAQQILSGFKYLATVKAGRGRSRGTFLSDPSLCLLTECRSACTILMRKIFAAARGQNQVPVLSDSLVMYYDTTHNIKTHINIKYTDGTYDHSKMGQYLAARRVVIAQVEAELTDEEKSRLQAFHDRRCRRWQKGLDTAVDGDDGVELDDEMSKEELEKLRKDMEKATEEQEKEAHEDAADAKVEDEDYDVPVILE
jgi:hypothetical protein